MTDKADEHPSNDRRPRRSAGMLTGCLATALILLPPYVLSTGPVVWLAQRGYVHPAIGLIYAPLALLANWVPFARTALNWYLRQWQ
jgi:hypothetical protein